MSYIDLKNDLPGIRGLMAYSPHTAKPLNELAEVLLRDEHNTLSRGERELIGAYVSWLNQCFFCQQVHEALAGHYLACPIGELDQIFDNLGASALPAKIKALLFIAGLVQTGGKSVSRDQVDAARDAGASDREIHDTILIAAAFCMFNRYVDGLGTWAPADRGYYVNRAPQRAIEGYIDFDLYK